MSNGIGIEAAWARIEAWLQKKAKRVAKALAGGATDEQVAALERRLGIMLPDDVRASWRIHNGADESDLFPASQPDEMAYSPLSLDGIAEASASMRSWPHWRPEWVPVATNGGGDYQAIDLTSGRIIEADHETGAVAEVATSWSARLVDLADGLEAKRYRYDADSGIIQAPDGMEDLRRALKLLADDATLPANPRTPESPPAEYAKALRAADPDGTSFAPASDRSQQAIRWFRGSSAYNLFYRYSEPTAVLELNGLRFYPVPQAIELSRPYYLPDVSKEWPLVIATTVAGGHRLFIDTTHLLEYPPIVMVAADLELTGKSWKQLASKWTVVAPTLLEFWRRLAAGTLELTPRPARTKSQR